MKTRMKLSGTSGAIAVALLALSFSVGSSAAVRADDAESLSAPIHDTVLVPLKDLKALEQRLAYLEGAVTALTESRQHDSHRICVSDNNGAETCITKAQLDAVLISQARVEVSHPAELVGEASVVPPAKPAAVEASQNEQQREETGTIIVTPSGAEASAVQSVATGDTETLERTVSAEISRKQEPAQTGATDSGPPAELNVISGTGISPQETYPKGDR
jgi:hypothetical protein